MDEDMKQIRFTIPGQPFGKQRPKFSRAGAYVKTYTPKETTSYENLVKLFYNEAAKGKMFPEGSRSQEGRTWLRAAEFVWFGRDLIITSGTGVSSTWLFHS